MTNNETKVLKTIKNSPQALGLTSVAARAGLEIYETLQALRSLQKGAKVYSYDMHTQTLYWG